MFIMQCHWYDSLSETDSIIFISIEPAFKSSAKQSAVPTEISPEPKRSMSTSAYKSRRGGDREPCFGPKQESAGSFLDQFAINYDSSSKRCMKHIFVMREIMDD